MEHISGADRETTLPTEFSDVEARAWDRNDAGAGTSPSSRTTRATSAHERGRTLHTQMQCARRSITACGVPLPGRGSHRSQLVYGSKSHESIAERGMLRADGKIAVSRCQGSTLPRRAKGP